VSFEECEASRAWIFGGELTARVPAVLSYYARHSMAQLPMDPTPVVPTRYWKPMGMATGSPGVSRAGL
jgi:hypothetical protein